MAPVVKIAGVTRTSDIKRENFQIDKALTSEEDSLKMTVKSGDKPEYGEEVIVEDGETTLFGGVINDVDDSNSRLDQYVCNVRDYTYQLDSKLVVEDYSGLTADAMVTDIVSKYAPGFTTNGVQAGAPAIEGMKFDYVQVSDAIRQIADYCGWHFKVDYNKDVKFFSELSYSVPAPMVLALGQPFRNFKVKVDARSLRNRVYVRGGKMQSDTYIWEIKADGVTGAWVLPHKPHNLKFFIAGVEQNSIGVENLHDEANFSYMMNYNEKYVRRSAQTALPTAGLTLRFEYNYDIDIITVAEDTSSQEAVKAIQGGDGVYEHVIVDDSLTTLEAAETAGLNEIAKNANPQIKGSFVTNVPGWEPGQIITVNLPSKGLNSTYLVQRVSINPFNAEGWKWTVEFGGKLLGIADVLKALVSGQKAKKIADTNVIHKFTYGTDQLVLTDEAVIEVKTDPWYTEYSQRLRLAMELGADLLNSETSQADFSAGTLTDVEAVTAGHLQLAFTPGVVRLAPDGTSGYVGLGTNSVMRQSSYITYEFKIILPTTGDTFRIGCGGQGGQGYGGILITNTSLFFYWTPTSPNSDTNTMTWFPGAGLEAGVEYHISFGVDFVNKQFRVTIDGTALTIDGQSQNPTNWTPYSSYSSGRTDAIGARYVNAFAYGKAKFRDVRVWNTFRTLQQIQDNRNVSLVGNESGLVGFWPCNDGSGSAVDDKTSTNNNGTISGTVAWEASSGTYDTSGNRLKLAVDLSSVRCVRANKISWEAQEWIGLKTDGVNGYVDLPIGSGVNAATTPFVVEFEVYLADVQQRCTLIGTPQGADQRLYVNIYDGQFYLGIKDWASTGLVAWTGLTKFKITMDGANAYLHYDKNDGNGWVQAFQHTYTSYVLAGNFVLGKAAGTSVYYSKTFFNYAKFTGGIVATYNFYEMSGTVIHDSVGTAHGVAYGGVSWHQAAVLVETSIDGASSWQTATNGEAISGIDLDDDLLGVNLLVRESLSTTDGLATPQLRWLDVDIDNWRVSDEIAMIGSMFRMYCQTPMWPIAQYRTYKDAAWSAWATVDFLSETDSAGAEKLQLRTNQSCVLLVNNYKKPSEAQSICGQVVVWNA